jgi:hypothetical protein
MAKQLIVNCDAAFTLRAKDCTETHDDTRTFTISVDGEAWEIDLGGSHAQALIALAHRGRSLGAKTTDTRSLERRVRGVPVLE